MDKKAIAVIALLAVAVFVGGFMLQNRSQNITSDSASSDASTGIVFYYGVECPHCKDVEKFLDDNKASEKMSFSKKEVWHDQANSAEMAAKAKSCGLQEKEIGVPFLYAEGKCYVGTPDVEAYFIDKLGLSAATK